MTKLYLPIIYDDFSFACDKAENMVSFKIRNFYD